MIDEGVVVRYGDFALNAKESFIPTASEKQDFVNLEQLQKNDLNFPKYANPCELYQTVLDGSASALPENMDTANLGYWSSQVTRTDKTFEIPVVLTFKANAQFKSVGFSLTFDVENNVFPNHMNITWFRNEEQIQTQDFYPDNAFYFAQKEVSNFDKVVMTFYSLNMPYNRLKLHVVDWGYGTYFYGNELMNVSVSQTIDPISSEIPINTCNLTILGKRNINYSFQSKQPLTVYYNGDIISKNFVNKAIRKGQQLWDVQADDYMGIMESMMFHGDVYVDKNAGELLEEIFNAAHVPFSMSDDIAGMTVSGYIPYTTCRDALMQVAFAVQAVVDTSNSEVVKVFTLDENVSQEIPLSRIRQGQSFANGEIITSVELTVHEYVKPKKGVEYVDAYDASLSGTGENILVMFTEPLYDLDIELGRIVESSANHAIINANSTNCTLVGKKYQDNPTVMQKRNNVVLISDIEKKVSVKDATLITKKNAQFVLDKCFDWLIKVDAVNLEIVDKRHVIEGNYVLYGGAKYGMQKYDGMMSDIVTYDKPVFVGDKITCDTEYLGKITGRVIKTDFSLNSNTMSKRAVLK